MQKLWLLIFFLALPSSVLFSQRVEIIPYPDAVSLSADGCGKVYLSNTDAKVLMEHFSAEFTPDKIIPVKDGYFSGYRLCFTSGSCHPQAESADWIQILTIDQDAALAWFKKNSPELLSYPFDGLKACVGENGYKMADYKEIVDRYRFISCKMYRQTIAPDGTETDEMTANIQRAVLKMSGKHEAQYVSVSSGGVFSNESSNRQNAGYNSVDEWIRCFEYIDRLGYVTLIEFNEPAILPF
jgi:hypothetical protein